MLAGSFIFLWEKYLYHKLEFPKLKCARNQELEKEVEL